MVERAPLVSVIIPSYNAELYVGETIESVLAQSWPNVEAIVVDDGSTDATLEVARRFESGSVHVITQPNGGAAAARNTGLRHAQGQYIQFLDADDLLHTSKIEIQINRLKAATPGAVASCAWARFFGEDYREARFVTQPDWRDFRPAMEWLIQSWSGSGTMPPVAWLVPRGLVDAAGFWDERLSLNDDGEYFARVLLEASEVVFCEGARGYYRSGLPSSLSGRQDEVALESYFLTCELNERHMLAVRNDQRTRHACACMWQAFLYLAYPRVPPLIRRAEDRIAQLGGGSVKPKGSNAFMYLQRVLGWKAAVRIRHALR